MERVTLRLPKKHVDELDELAEEEGEFSNRSEAVRAAVREFLKDERRSSSRSDRGYDWRDR